MLVGSNRNIKEDSEFLLTSFASRPNRLLRNLACKKENLELQKVGVAALWNDTDCPFDVA